MVQFGNFLKCRIGPFHLISAPPLLRSKEILGGGGGLQQLLLIISEGVAMSVPLIFLFLKGGMCRHFDQKI